MKERRKIEPIVKHVFNKSIAEYKIFLSDEDYRRMIEAMQFYKYRRKISFSNFLRMKNDKKIENLKIDKSEKLVDIITYCLMPTHIHFILCERIENGISIFMQNLLNSYSKYFNSKMRRKGPLWESKYRFVLVNTDEQLLHLTRYIHLNPTTSFLVDKPENWKFSSYNEYLNNSQIKICDYEDFLKINPGDYKKFVEDRISYQRELAKIRKIIME